MDTVSIAYANLGFSVVDWDCATGYFSFGHELGHNMGAAHDWYADDSKDLPFSHNKGYVNLSDSWRTIMAYNEECDCSDEVEPCPAPGLRTTPGLPLCTRLQYWSNPDVKYNDDPMGVPVGSSTACVKGDLVHPDCDADVRDVLNKTANTVANFRHPERLNIAVTPFQYDHVGGLLEELNYSWTQVLDTDLNTYEKISHYDIIFANSSLAGLVNGPDAAEAIKKFVKNGGSFYASDFAYTYVSSAFPDHLRVFDPPHLGSQEVVTVDIVDAGLASYLNPSNPPGTIDLTYTQDGWVPIENVSEDADVHFQVEIPVSETETEIIPLAASFMPYKNSAGRVTYTSFNNYPQIKDMEKKLVKYLLLTTYASKIAEEAEQVITSADGTLSQTSLNTINKDGKSDKTAYNVDEISDLAFVLHWPGSALKFKVFQPNGDLFSQDETNSPPITIFVPAAQSGEWAYQVEGVDVPFENYPHAVSVGYQNLYTSHIYLPTILDK
jgi:hypothetical protein